MLAISHSSGVVPAITAEFNTTVAVACTEPVAVGIAIVIRGGLSL